MPAGNPGFPTMQGLRKSCNNNTPNVLLVSLCGTLHLEHTYGSQSISCWVICCWIKNRKTCTIHRSQEKVGHPDCSLCYEELHCLSQRCRFSMIPKSAFITSEDCNPHPKKGENIWRKGLVRHSWCTWIIIRLNITTMMTVISKPHLEIGYCNLAWMQ